MKRGIRECVVDAHTGRMIFIRDLYNDDIWYLEGECLRCGICCSGRDQIFTFPSPCEDLIVENIDGKDVYSCRLEPTPKHSMKPWGCKLSPKPEEIRPGCGFR